MIGTKLIAMVIIGWIPQPDGSLKESWRLERTVTIDHCLTMNRFSGGGRGGAITVRCGTPGDPNGNDLVAR